MDNGFIVFGSVLQVVQVAGKGSDRIHNQNIGAGGFCNGAVKRRPGKVGGQQCQQPADFCAALWEQEAALEVQTGSAWAPHFLFIEFLP